MDVRGSALAGLFHARKYESGAPREGQRLNSAIPEAILLFDSLNQARYAGGDGMVTSLVASNLLYRYFLFVKSLCM